MVGVLLSLPRVLFLKETASFVPIFRPGYLVADSLTLGNFLSYWFTNLGLSFFLIPLGFTLAPRQPRKLFVAFFSLFIVGNLIQFSPEIAGNHKFFNVFLVVGNMFMAFLAIRLWKAGVLGKFLFFPLILLVTLSGIIDFFPVKNDVYMQLDDYPRNPDVKWIMENTPGDAVFLNSSYLYHPASLAGRKIFLGWPYFAWSLGHDTNSRSEEVRKLHSMATKQDFCKLLNEVGVNFFETQPTVETEFQVNFSLLGTEFVPVYTNSATRFTVYNVATNCRDVN